MKFFVSDLSNEYNCKNMNVIEKYEYGLCYDFLIILRSWIW